MRLLRTAALAALTIVLSAGCFGSTEVESTVAGTYTLVTVNGSPLPFIQTATNTVIVDDVFKLYLGLTFSEVLQTKVNGQATTLTTNRSGAFNTLGTSVSLLVNETGRTRVAKVVGKTMTIVEDGVTFVYQKS